MEIFAGIIITTLIAFNFIFVFWRKLKDDFRSELIFNLVFYSGTLGLIFFLLSIKFLPDWWFWSILLGEVIGLGVAVFKFKLSILEIISAYAIFFLSQGLLINIYLIQHGGLIWILICAILIIIYNFLNANYKRFHWYKSGKIGFAAFTVFGLFFLIRAIIGIAGFNMLSLAPVDAFISGVVSFVSFSFILYLSRKA